jgi:hypothetical protein
VVVPRGAEILRVKQVLLNLVLRTRTAYAQAVREPDLERRLSDLAGPLRACAAALLDLEGTPAPDARTALEQVAAADARFAAAVDAMVAVRRGATPSRPRRRARSSPCSISRRRCARAPRPCAREPVRPARAAVPAAVRRGRPRGPGRARPRPHPP